MSEVRTFLRFCPACGRRFHIKLVGKKLLDERMEQTEVKRDVGAIAGMSSRYMMTTPTVVEENVPVTIDVEEFQYSYKCKHCGHVWTELHDEEKNLDSSGRSLKR
jgi:hypothetical protein